MEQLVNAFWRTVYRLGYPCAQVVWQLARTPGRGATIAVWHEGRLLCVRESYRRGLGLPGGGSHGAEAPVSTARRELREEVGLELDPEWFHDRGLLAYPIGARLIEDWLFEVHLDEALEPVVDAREIVWAGYLEPGEIRAAGMQRGLRLYLERTGHCGDLS